MGGGEGSTAREILRHKTVEKVVMCDIDEVTSFFALFISILDFLLSFSCIADSLRYFLSLIFFLIPVDVNNILFFLVLGFFFSFFFCL